MLLAADTDFNAAADTGVDASAGTGCGPISVLPGRSDIDTTAAVAPVKFGQAAALHRYRRAGTNAASVPALTE